MDASQRTQASAERQYVHVTSHPSSQCARADQAPGVLPIKRPALEQLLDLRVLEGLRLLEQLLDRELVGLRVERALTEPRSRT